MKLFFILLYFSATLFSSCKNLKKQEFEKKFAREPDDSAKYSPVKYNLYLSKTGQLCEKKWVMARPRDSSCNCDFLIRYDSTFSFYDNGRAIQKPLGSILDINSYKLVDSTDFSKDNKNVYYFFGNSDGGNRVIVKEADPTTFRRLCEYRWGIDKNYVFFQDKKLTGLKPDKIKIFYSSDTSDHLVEYVMDDELVYMGDQIVIGANPKTFYIQNNPK